MVLYTANVAKRDVREPAVGLITDNPTGCGLSRRIGPTSHSSSYIMPARQPPCRSPTNSSIAHEIGHILGLGMTVLWTRTTRRSPMGMATSTTANGATS